MTILKNTLSTVIETWDDPGDYPSNAGQHPLPSYQYIAGIEGELHVALTRDESHYLRIIELSPTYANDIQEWIANTIDDLGVPMPNGIDTIEEWCYLLYPDRIELRWDGGAFCETEECFGDSN